MKRKLSVEAHAFTNSAREAIEKAGGSVKVLGEPKARKAPKPSKAPSSPRGEGNPSPPRGEGQGEGRGKRENPPAE